MNNLPTLLTNQYFLIFITAWEIVWKGLALWKAARNNSKYWFIAILVLNSLGILPIIYLLINKYKKTN